MAKKRAPSNNPEGRPLADPDAGPRVTLNARVSPRTMASIDQYCRLRSGLAEKPVSRGQMIDYLVDQFIEHAREKLSATGLK